MIYNFTTVEKKWQKHWLDNKSFAALDPDKAGDMPKAYILDMFPYPSGAGLHVGHPVGWTGTEIVCRYKRMKGFNVLHPMGWDAFGLPAEQYAVKNNVHPAITTKANIERFRQQIQMLGLSYDWDREVNTTDPGYYKWTQWIFLQLFNSYFDPVEQKALPISTLQKKLLNEELVVGPDNSLHANPTIADMKQFTGEMRIEAVWRELGAADQRDVIDSHRLAYADDAPVNWCPALGTVLANEEVIDGKSEVGGFPVERKPMRQWMLRITAYSDRLVDDLDKLDWPESLKEMQRNWIGKSIGAEVDFDIAGAAENADGITVFTTRPDTLFGATYMVLAPEHGLVSQITSTVQREAVEAYLHASAGRSDRDRMADSKEKTGVFTGANAINPANGKQIPIYIADYVLMGYGTGAIMAVPAHDDRDFAFAKKYQIPIVQVVASDDGKKANADAPFTDEGIVINSDWLDGKKTADAKTAMINWLKEKGVGYKSVKYKLRDWLFSRQRYWGEPFPLLLDAQGNAHAISEAELPLTLPELADFKPTGTPDGPLSKATDWLKVTTAQGQFTRETNTMPQWAGSCWYYLRYIDPKNPDRFVDPAKEKYWMPVDLYVGGVEHAVLHLLYSRFWHKVLFDLGHVSTPEPFQRLVNQGLLLGEVEYTAFADDSVQVSTADLRDIQEEATETGVVMFGIETKTGKRINGQRITDESLLEKKSDGYYLKSNPKIRIDARSFKMSKSRGNVVTPDEIVKSIRSGLRRELGFMGRWHFGSEIETFACCCGDRLEFGRRSTLPRVAALRLLQDLLVSGKPPQIGDVVAMADPLQPTMFTVGAEPRLPRWTDEMRG